MRQGRHEALSNRIVDDVENDRDGVGRPLSCGSNRRAAADDEVRCRTHQLCRVSLDLTQISTRVSMLDLDIAVLGPAERLETLAKCNDPSQHFGIVLGVWMQECDAPHALALLRARRERPRRCAAEQRDERAPLHSITSSARASRVGGTSRPIALAVCRLMTNSNLVACTTGRSAGFSPLRMRPA